MARPQGGDSDFTKCQLRSKLDAFDSDEGLKNLVKNCDEEMLIMERQEDEDWLRIKSEVDVRHRLALSHVQTEKEMVERYLQATDASRSNWESDIKEVRVLFNRELKKLQNAYTSMESHLNKLGYSRLREQSCVKNKAVAVALQAQDELKAKIEKGELDPDDPKVREEKADADRAAKAAVDKHMTSVYKAAFDARKREERKKRKIEEEQS